MTNPGDKVVIFSPFYENYGADTILTGAEPIYVPLTPPEFTFDPEVLENAFRQHPKALILCNPSNPLRSKISGKSSAVRLYNSVANFENCKRAADPLTELQRVGCRFFIVRFFGL